MSNLRNDPDGHLEFGFRITIEQARGNLPTPFQEAESAGNALAWADFAEALLEDAEKWNEYLDSRISERKDDDIP